MKKIPCVSANNGRMLSVAKETTVEWTVDEIRYQRTLPKGFVFRTGTDKITLATSILTLFGYPYAFLSEVAVHDYLYQEKETAPERAVSRYVADNVFLSKEDQFWLRRVVYYVIRTFGYFPWKW